MKMYQIEEQVVLHISLQMLEASSLNPRMSGVEFPHMSKIRVQEPKFLLGFTIHTASSMLHS